MSTRDSLFAALAGNRSGTETRGAERESSLRLLHERLHELEFGKRNADVEHFLSRAAEAGTQVHRCVTLQEAAALLSVHIGRDSECVLADDPLLRRMELHEQLAKNGIRVHQVPDEDLAVNAPGARRLYAAADFGVTAAIAGLADSGAILISSSENESRSVSLLPVEHIALLPAGRIMPSLLQAAPMLRRLTGTEGTSAVTLVGGPSKTADIEKVLVTGVHGPAVLTVIVIDDID